MHVEADIRLLNYLTRAIATFGYASAEAILSLRLLRGNSINTPPIVEARVSLARSMAAVCTWDIKEFHGDRRFTLTVDYPLPPGDTEPFFFFAVVQAEIWVGSGAGIANASLQCRVERFRVSTTC